ncbi:hypothetical protein B0J13DRAFT_618330 [Dactylonectria estremocensis]|uniref:Uncharacterized protein n=1 Tax=Dactylonectria estremocensis TaxID=1079267 RepID=A0A9P9J749_9HYPO|nr:hypothetical protein B0J13DRAFT_618330 [Dactylonectria estremocensis]
MELPSYKRTVWDDCGLPSSRHVSQNCNLARGNITPSARHLLSGPSSSASMANFPSDKSVRSLLNGINPGLSVQGLEAVPSARPQLFYNVKVSDGPSLLLALPPPPVIMRLLRSEKSSIGTENEVLKWLSGLPRGEKTHVASKEGVVNKSTTELRSGQKEVNLLFEYLPVLIKPDAMAGGPAVEYSLTRPRRGVPIASFPRPLTHRERRIADFQTGQLLRRIAKHSSPSHRFGIAADVLDVPPYKAERLGGGLNSTRGAESWSVAFHSLLESILRDAEDHCIMIGYGAIRRHFDRFKHLLDAVTEPRLVVLDAAEDTNTLVEPAGLAKKEMSSPGAMTGNQQESNTVWRTTIRSEKYMPSRESSDTSNETGSEDEDIYTVISDAQGKDHIEVTGLQQWSNCLFGDPLIAPVFSKPPNRDIWNGFDRPLPEEKESSKGSSSNVVDDESNAPIRLLLYKCYHAVAAIVREFYRPQKDSSKRELAARKQLGDVLVQLDNLDNFGAPRRRRPSGEVSPAKRSKSSDDDGSDC